VLDDTEPADGDAFELDPAAADVVELAVVPELQALSTARAAAATAASGSGRTRLITNHLLEGTPLSCGPTTTTDG
jgi:hypothetical protein